MDTTFQAVKGFVAQFGSETRLLPSQTPICHGEHGHCDWTPDLREFVEQGHAHMQIHLTLKRACHHPFAQTLEAVHLGLNQASAVTLLNDGNTLDGAHWAYEDDRPLPPALLTTNWKI